jgi:deazaflavin-dependent oxidoreductase (nitroreductase family)
MRDATARRLSTLHRLTYAATSGRLGRRLVRNEMLLLTTVGRSSGRRHTVPLLYLADTDDNRSVIVIASWGGRDRHPDWYVNLVANPAVEVQIEGTRYRASAAPLHEPERIEWWRRAVAAYPGYQEYQRRTERRIPLVRVTPEYRAPSTER